MVPRRHRAKKECGSALAVADDLPSWRHRQAVTSAPSAFWTRPPSSKFPSGSQNPSPSRSDVRTRKTISASSRWRKLPGSGAFGKAVTHASARSRRHRSQRSSKREFSRRDSTEATRQASRRKRVEIWQRAGLREEKEASEQARPRRTTATGRRVVCERRTRKEDKEETPRLIRLSWSQDTSYGVFERKPAPDLIRGGYRFA